ncbi:MAG: AAA family ATPase [Methanobacterium sp.]
MKVIAIEGPDGFGKSVLAARLAQALGFTLVKFPDYASESGQEIKSILEQPEDKYFDAVHFQNLQHQNKLDKINTLDPDGCYVWDRGPLSELIYALANGLNETTVRKQYEEFAYPDVTVVISGSAYRHDGDIFDSDKFQDFVQELYFRESKTIDGNVIRVNNGTSKDEIFEYVLKEVRGISL